ncbi:alpha-mannosyltransferase [Nannochloropsis oceanica]
MIPSSSHNRTSYGSGRFSYKWLARGVVLVIILDLLLQVRFFFPGHSLRGGAACTSYDPVATPHILHLLHTTFNTTPSISTATPEALFEGQGVVMAASGAISRQAAGAYVTAFVLRHVLHETLPIEIFYSGPEEAFHGPVLEALKTLSNVHLIDLEQALTDLHSRGLMSLEPLPPLRVLKGYAAKVYAMQACSFQEALLFDAGVIPFASSSLFFSLPSYKRQGLAVFSDYVSIDQGLWKPFLRDMCLDLNHVFRSLGGRELDSSCVVMDKLKNADALSVAVALNGPLQRTTYVSLLGDKDTWALGMFFVGKTVSVHEVEPGYLLVAREEGREEGPRHARKVNGHLQFLRNKSVQEPPGLVPLHHNNQLLDLREFPLIGNRIYMDVFSKLGDVLMPGTRRRDCRGFGVEGLLPLSSVMREAYGEIARDLKEKGINHCVCRDDWMSCEADIERLRKKHWVLRVIDYWAPTRWKEARMKEARARQAKDAAAAP